MKTEAWWITLKPETRGPRRRSLLGATFNADDVQERTRKLMLTEAQVAELRGNADYGMRKAAAEERPAPQTSIRERRGGAPNGAQASAPDPITTTEEEA